MISCRSTDKNALTVSTTDVFCTILSSAEMICVLSRSVIEISFVSEMKWKSIHLSLFLFLCDSHDQFHRLFHFYEDERNDQCHWHESMSLSRLDWLTLSFCMSLSFLWFFISLCQTIRTTSSILFNTIKYQRSFHPANFIPKEIEEKILFSNFSSDQWVSR